MGEEKKSWRTSPVFCWQFSSRELVVKSRTAELMLISRGDRDAVSVWTLKVFGFRAAATEDI
jgi:hypothetical protein